MVGGRWRFALVLAVTLAGLTPALRAESPEELFSSGNTAYGARDYAAAVRDYEAALEHGIRDARLEYNLANALFRVGSLGGAILHFERARRLDPTDAEIQANLEYARTFCFDRVELPEQAAILKWVQSVQNRVGPDRQAWALLAVVWLLAALLAWCFAVPGRWSAGHGWTLAGLLLVLALGTLSWRTTLDRLEGHPIGVIVVESVEVLAGPGANNPTLFTVHEGLILEIRSERPDWVQVSLPNGLNGWIGRDRVEIV